MSNNVLRVPRETTEFQEIVVDVDGEPVLEGLELAFTTDDGRPVIWTAATIHEGKTGFTITGLAPGDYNIWIRINAGAADKPVRFAGILVIT